MTSTTDLALTDEQVALSNAARGFLQRACTPELVRRVRTPDGPGHDPELWRAMAGLGWLGLPFTGSVGGGGGDLLDLAVVCEEAGRALVPTTLASTLEAALLLDIAGGGQRSSLLPPIVAGERIVSLAVEEGGGPPLPGGLATVAARDGDDVVIDGTKLFVPNAGVADDLIVLARDATGGAADGVCLAVVPAGVPGVSCTSLGTFARDAQHEVSLAGARVPVANVVAPPGGAWLAVERARRIATALCCAEMVGGARAVLERTVGYVADRVQFGRALGSFQAVQHQVAEVSIRVDAAGLAAWQAVGHCARAEAPAGVAGTQLAAGVPDDGRAGAGLGPGGPAGADAAVAIAKVAATDAYLDATLVAHQLHGGIGFATDHDLHLWSDRARSAALLHGSRWDHLRRIGSIVGSTIGGRRSGRPSTTSMQ